LCEGSNIIECQYVFARSIKDRFDSIAELFRNFIERHFAIVVLVESLKHLFGIRSSFTNGTGAAWHGAEFGHRLAEFISAQRVFAQLFKDLAEAIA